MHAFLRVAGIEVSLQTQRIQQAAGAFPNGEAPCLIEVRGLEWGAWQCPTFTRVIRTIIGAEAFHCPVRDGKEWYHLAMAARH